MIYISVSFSTKKYIKKDHQICSVNFIFINIYVKYQKFEVSLSLNMYTEQNKENRAYFQAQFLLLKLLEKQSFLIGKLLNGKYQSTEFTQKVQTFIELMVQLAELQKSNIQVIEKTQIISQKEKILQILQRGTLKQGTIKLQGHRAAEQVKDFLINHPNKSKQATDEFLQKHSPWINQKKRTSVIRMLISKFEDKICELKGNTLSADQLKAFMARVIRNICIRVMRSATGSFLEISHAQKMKFGILVCSEIAEQLFDLDSLHKTLRLGVLTQAIELSSLLQLKIEKISMRSIKQQNTIEMVKGVVKSFPKIRKLGLAYCELGIKAIFVLKNLFFLQRLDLSGNHIDNQGAKQLSKTQYRHLEKLSLCQNPISNKGLYYLAKNNWSQLCSIYLDQCHLTQDGLKLFNKFAGALTNVTINPFPGLISQRNHSYRGLDLQNYGQLQQEDPFDL